MTSPTTQWDQLEVTNQCVVLCNLRTWTSPDAPNWQVLKGSQDDVGRALAAAMDAVAVTRIDDFGGVSKTFLWEGESYRVVPPRITGARSSGNRPSKRLLVEQTVASMHCAHGNQRWGEE